MLQCPNATGMHIHRQPAALAPVLCRRGAIRLTGSVGGLQEKHASGNNPRTFFGWLSSASLFAHCCYS